MIPNKVLNIHQTRRRLSHSQLAKSLFDLYIGGSKIHSAYDINDLISLGCNEEDTTMLLHNPIKRSTEVYLSFLFQDEIKKMMFGKNESFLENIQSIMDEKEWGNFLFKTSYNVLVYGTCFIKIFSKGDEYKLEIINNEQISDVKFKNDGKIEYLDISKTNYKETWDLERKHVRLIDSEKGNTKKLTFSKMGIEEVPVYCIHYMFNESEKKSYPYYWNILPKLDAYNFILSTALDRALRFDKPLLVMSSESKSNKKAPKFKKGNFISDLGNKETVIALPPDLRLDSIQIDTNYTSVMAVLEIIFEEIKADVPVLGFRDIQGNSNLSGKTVKYILSDAISAVNFMRSIIESGLVTVFDKFLSIKTGKKVSSEIVFRQRPVIKVSLFEEAELIKLFRDSGVPFTTILRWLGKEQEEIDKFVEELEEERSDILRLHNNYGVDLANGNWQNSKRGDGTDTPDDDDEGASKDEIEE